MIRSIVYAMLLAGSAMAGSPAMKNGSKVALVDGYAFVEVVINHRGPFRMLVDSGATSCAMTPDAGRTAGLVYDHQVLLNAETGGERPIPAAYATVRVESVEANSVDVLSDRLEGVQRLNTKVDGVLGQSFLGRFPYLVDYQRKRLLLGDDARRASVQLGPEVAVTQAFGRIVVAVTLDPEEQLWRVILDMGASGLILQCGSQCPQLGGLENAGRIVTNAGDWRVRRGKTARLEVGGLAIAHAEVYLLDMPAPADHDGLLPARWFSAVYVDAGRNVVRLAANVKSRSGTAGRPW